MQNGSGLKYNKSLTVDQLKDFGAGQSLDQDRPNHMPDADGSWNKAYEGNLKQGGWPESSACPKGGK